MGRWSQRLGTHVFEASLTGKDLGVAQRAGHHLVSSGESAKDLKRTISLSINWNKYMHNLMRF